MELTQLHSKTQTIQLKMGRGTDGHNLKDKKQQVLVRTWGKGSPSTVQGDCKLVQPLHSSMELPQKTKNITTIQPSNPTFEYLPKGKEVRILRRNLFAPRVHGSFTDSSQDQETT